MSRASSRAPVPSRKVREATGGADQPEARATGRVGFAQFARQHADEVGKRGGEEPGDGEDDEVEEVCVVPSERQTSAADEPKQKKKRTSKKWNTLFDLALAQKGELKFFCVCVVEVCSRCSTAAFASVSCLTEADLRCEGTYPHSRQERLKGGARLLFVIRYVG